MSKYLIFCFFSVSNNTDSEAAGSIQFAENYKQRFGEPLPNFYTGSLEDALKEACHKPAREVGIKVNFKQSVFSKYFLF